MPRKKETRTRPARGFKQKLQQRLGMFKTVKEERYEGDTLWRVVGR